MTIPFQKYQGTGNDFVLIDQRTEQYFTRNDTDQIQRICDRRFGVGADGLILLQNKEGYDFEMIYFNADGRESSMCGNGGRCIVAFAKYLGIIEMNKGGLPSASTHFLAIDGPHEATTKGADWVSLKMTDVPEVEQGPDYFVMNTGSPHYVVFVEDIDDIDVVENGKAIRYSKRFREEGINVNFVEKKKDGIIVATYERGVEDETLSCGTGATAASIAYQMSKSVNQETVTSIEVKGGELSVKFTPDGKGGAKNIWLQGKATRVFAGKLER